MASTSSRLERLVKLIGEENLPAKQIYERAADTTRHDRPLEQTNAPIQSEPEFAGGPDSNKWWQLPEPSSTSSLVNQPYRTASTHHSATSHLSHSHMRDSAPLGLNFTPLIAITKFPYKFVDHRWMQPLSSVFFDGGKIWERQWDIYYIWSSYWPNPVTFVPEHQLLALISEINQAFPSANVYADTDARDAGLVIQFDEFRDRPDLRPWWIGRSTSRSQYDSLVGRITMSNPAHAAGLGNGDRSLKAFQAKMELAIEAGKKRSKAAKAKRRSENVAKRQNMAKSLLRAQRYLGFLPVQEDSSLPNSGSLSTPANFNSKDPSCHPFDLDVVFIAFDVEAYERSPRQITEIGVATLDTRDVRTLAPGTTGEYWHRFIRARHFRIEEYKNYKNYEFVQGCPDQFEFGESEFISKDSIGKALSTCFKPPFGSPDPRSKDEKRNIVVLGHDISQDIAYLQQVGFNLLNARNIHDKLDTAEMYRVYTKDPNARSLGSIIYDFNLTGWNLHNAGNDAVYTIWAFLAICVGHTSEHGSAGQAQKNKDILEQRAHTAVEQAMQKVKDEREGWEITE